MNEIFPCLAYYSQKLSFFFGNWDKDKYKLCEEEEMGTIFLKSDIYDPL